MKKPLTIWFDDKGNMLDYASSWSVGTNASRYNYKSELGEDFEDVLTFHRMQNYRSPKVVFKSTKTGRQYYMFLDDFSDVLKMHRLQNNEIAGTFKFVKKGQSQGFKIAWSEQENDQIKELNKRNF